MPSVSVTVYNSKKQVLVCDVLHVVQKHPTINNIIASAIRRWECCSVRLPHVSYSDCQAVSCMRALSAHASCGRLTVKKLEIILL